MSRSSFPTRRPMNRLETYSSRELRIQDGAHLTDSFICEQSQQLVRGCSRPPSAPCCPSHEKPAVSWHQSPSVTDLAACCVAPHQVPCQNLSPVASVRFLFGCHDNEHVRLNDAVDLEMQDRTSTGSIRSDGMHNRGNSGQNGS